MKVLTGQAFFLWLIKTALLSVVCASVAFSDDDKDGIVTDRDGNAYRVVVIDNQTWMAQNLRVTHYTDSVSVESFVYDNDTANAALYGRLYRSAAALGNPSGEVSDSARIQGVCPCGWHVPSEAEWQQLVDYLGGDAAAGEKLRDGDFAALPAGWFDFTGSFDGLGEVAFFLTAEVESKGGIKALQITNKGTSVKRVNLHPRDAISVRCVKD